jgi:Carboxypeptidase regulatory-like domain
MAGNNALARPAVVFRSRFSKCSARQLTLTLTLLGCVFGSSLVRAQATTSVRGSVTDPSGNAILGATIVLANHESRTERIVETGDQGQYQFLLIVPHGKSSRLSHL